MAATSQAPENHQVLTKKVRFSDLVDAKNIKINENHSDKENIDYNKRNPAKNLLNSLDLAGTEKIESDTLKNNKFNKVINISTRRSKSPKTNSVKAQNHSRKSNESNNKLSDRSKSPLSKSAESSVPKSPKSNNSNNLNDSDLVFNQIQTHNSIKQNHGTLNNLKDKIKVIRSKITKFSMLNNNIMESGNDNQTNVQTNQDTLYKS